MDLEQQAMAEVAREYCHLIETLDDGEPGVLERLLGLLPRLHAAVTALGSGKTSDDDLLEADLDARFELFSRLRQFLGERDAYWMEFDNASDGQSMSGSLADDLTDIYCELKHGLLMLEEDQRHFGRTINGWRHGYKRHWGQHLIDAERHLYDLQARDELLL